jgi:hypothetical protein
MLPLPPAQHQAHQDYIHDNDNLDLVIEYREEDNKNSVRCDCFCYNTGN